MKDVSLTKHGKTINASVSEELIKDMATNHGIDVEQELFNILALEIDRELYAERTGTPSHEVTDEMAKSEQMHRAREIVKQIKLSQPKD